jgi:hypothetical protein
MSEVTGVGIGIGASFGVIAFLGLGYAFYTGNLSGAGGFIKPFLFALANFIPFGLITFGFIADMIGQEFRYSIPSIMAMCAIILNRIVGLFGEARLSIASTTSGVGQENNMWCFVPGLEALESKLLPMNFVVMGSILTYYLIFGSLNRNINQNYSLIAAMGLFPLLQGLAFYMGDCNKYYAWGLSGNFFALLFGVVIGAISYGIVNATDPSRSPFGYSWTGSGSVQNNAPASGYQGAQRPPGLGAPSSGAKCSAADTTDDNAFVCEAYKNGVLVTEKIN